ncbi:penicillin-binding protein 1C [Burkholderia mallei]|nr:penicillin-binding protein 1C [Burkholderia mallei]
MRRDWRSTDWLLLARDGTPLQRTRVELTERRGDWIALADVSPAFREAIVVSEDKRFYAHSGVDWRGIAGAAWGNLWNERTRGASTVTMQLAGLLSDTPRRSGQRSLPQKAAQAMNALRLERGWRKDQILEAYLNLVPFRGETVGLDAMSHALFGKAPSGLDVRESAVAAALVRAPNASAAKVAERACRILRDLRAAQPCESLDGYVRFVTSAPPGAARDGGEALAPHFARRVAAEVKPGAGARVRSTLDAPLQRFARDTLTRALAELNAPAHRRHVQDGAVVVIDNATGEIRAWVGSSGALSAARDVDAVLAPRQAGSTLKPFLYAQALDERRLTAASLLDDAPIDLAAGGGLYIPQNYDKHFKGWVSVRTALGGSLNVPAVRTLVLVTPHRFARTLTALGLPLAEEGDYYGFSLALGSADVTLLSLANAYRALANGGVARATLDVPGGSGSRNGNGNGNDAVTSAPFAPTVSKSKVGASAVFPRAVSTKAEPAKPVPTAALSPTSASTSTAGKPAAHAAAGTRVFSEAAAYIVTDILADNNARVRTFGFDSPLATRFFSAVKTGTSKDMRDNWALGYTSRYTVGVWVGNADGSPMWDVSGVTGAAPVWAAIVGYLHRDLASRAPRPPARRRRAAPRRVRTRRRARAPRVVHRRHRARHGAPRRARDRRRGRRRPAARAAFDRRADRRHDLRDRSGHPAEAPANLVRARGGARGALLVAARRQGDRPRRAPRVDAVAGIAPARARRRARQRRRRGRLRGARRVREDGGPTEAVRRPARAAQAARAHSASRNCSSAAFILWIAASGNSITSFATKPPCSSVKCTSSSSATSHRPRRSSPSADASEPGGTNVGRRNVSRRSSCSNTLCTHAPTSRLAMSDSASSSMSSVASS